MSLLPGAKRAQFKQPRHPLGWYTEPRWCDRQLFEAVQFVGPIHDPCCGEGRIPEAAIAAGYVATGSDIADRGYGISGVDFHQDNTPRHSVIFNPPSNPKTGIYIDPLVHHALAVASQAVAIIVPVPFLCGQDRYWELYRQCPPAYVLACSQRPSMPPGGLGIAEKSGTTDYCWLIWTRSPLEWRRQCAIVPTAWWQPHHGTIVDWLKPIRERSDRSPPGTGLPR
jgi:hypothetical protein